MKLSLCPEALANDHILLYLCFTQLLWNWGCRTEVPAFLGQVIIPHIYVYCSAVISGGRSNYDGVKGGSQVTWYKEQESLHKEEDVKPRVNVLICIKLRKLRNVC